MYKLSMFLFLYMSPHWLLNGRNLCLQSLVVNHAAHCLFVSFCLGFLFAPKVAPLVRDDIALTVKKIIK